MQDANSLLPPHGGFRQLKSFQVAQLVYDVTVRFCDQFIAPRSRTHDQMVQAARSGVQNIAEGSQVSGTSKKMELKLTNVARASLEELRLDYEDFLRQRGLVVLGAEDPALGRFKARRCKTVEEVAEWVREERRRGVREHGEGRGGTDEHGLARTGTDEDRKRRQALSSAALAANGVLSLLNLCCYLLDRQLAAQAAAFEREGGFTERLYKRRQEKRREQ